MSRVSLVVELVLVLVAQSCGGDGDVDSQVQGDFGSSEPWHSALPEIQNGLRGQDDDEWRLATMVLARLPEVVDRPDVVGNLLDLAKSDDEFRRATAIALLAHASTQRKEVDETLRQALSDASIPVRLAAAGALADARVGRRVAVSALRKALTDQDENVRLTAVISLSKLVTYDPETMKAVASSLKDKTAAVRLHACWFIGRASHKVSSQIIEGLQAVASDHSSPLVAKWASIALQQVATVARRK